MKSAKFEMTLNSAREAFRAVRSYSPPAVVIKREGARVYLEKVSVPISSKIAELTKKTG